MSADSSPTHTGEQDDLQRRETTEEDQDPSFSSGVEDSSTAMAASAANVTSRSNSPENVTGLRRSKRKRSEASFKSDSANESPPVQEQKLDPREQRLSQRSPSNDPDDTSPTGIFGPGSMTSTDHPSLAVPLPSLEPLQPDDSVPPVETAAGEYLHGGTFGDLEALPLPEVGDLPAATPPHDAALEASPVPSDQAGEEKQISANEARHEPVEETNVAFAKTATNLSGPSSEELKDAPNDRAKEALITWYERLKDLRDYKEIHGDCNVPQKYSENEKLGNWVNKQRNEYTLHESGKKCSLTPRKIAALEKVGFEKAKPKGDKSWDIRFQELVDYNNSKGDCLVPTKWKENKALGRWVSTQRSEYKKWQNDDETSSMTPERVEKLNALGFSWTGKP